MSSVATIGTTRVRRPRAVVSLLALLIFLGLTALGGGVELLLFPEGNEFVSPEWLEEIPWVDSYVVPGLILSTVFGLGSLVVAYGVARRPIWTWLERISRTTGHHWSWSGTLALGVGLLVWLIVEVALLPERSAIEVFYALVALAMIVLVLRSGVRVYLASKPGA